tara:strand:+ start:5508 stop:5666 length:159 start_codon:yes stop_codon:yes gene_type:complete
MFPDWVVLALDFFLKQDPNLLVKMGFSNTKRARSMLECPSPLLWWDIQDSNL